MNNIIIMNFMLYLSLDIVYTLMDNQYLDTMMSENTDPDSVACAKYRSRFRLD